MLCVQVGDPFRRERSATAALAQFRTWNPLVICDRQGEYRALIPAGRRPDAVHRELRRNFPMTKWRLVELSDDGLLTELKEEKP